MRFHSVRRTLGVLTLLAFLGCESEKTTQNLPEKGVPPPPPGGMNNKNYDSKKSKP